MAINSLLPETFNKLIERDQSGPVTPTLEDSAGVLRSQLQMITAGLVSFRKQLETARGTDVTRLKERIATYQATQSRLAPKLAELDLQIEAQRYIDGTMNSQDEITADDVLAKYDGQDLSCAYTIEPMKDGAPYQATNGHTVYIRARWGIFDNGRLVAIAQGDRTDYKAYWTKAEAKYRLTALQQAAQS
jgi:hypothetical protein